MIARCRTLISDWYQHTQKLIREGCADEASMLQLADHYTGAAWLLEVLGDMDAGRHFRAAAERARFAILEKNKN